MDDVLKKKINLLLHLANADGKFHSTEKKFLQDLLASTGLKDYELNHMATTQSPFEGVENTVEKEELLYWALQLIKVDGEIHPDEVAYCKTIAIKLGFMPNLIDHFQDKTVPALETFKEEAGNYRFKI